MSKQVDWPYVINLGNSIIGVSILAMPFCFKECGIILGVILLLSCAYLTQVSCNLLMKGAFAAKRRSYEFLALFAFGPGGKLSVEISLIGLLIGTCIAFHVIIGDLGPAIISRNMAIENSGELRTFVMVFLGLFVALPLGLLRNVESLSNISAISLGFYTVFVAEVLTAAFPNIWSGVWVTKVQLWVPEGIFKCIPIFSLAFGCQSQLFVMYDALPDPSLKRMNSISKYAISMCTILYLAVGFFGYVAFCDEELSGDILLNFRSTIFSEAVKLGFCLAVAVSFPLVIFPCRAAIHTLLFAKTGLHDNFSGTVIIPEPHFKLITVSIVLFTLGVGIAIPNIEFILALTGATMGSMICYIFPAVLFINLMSLSKTSSKFCAQVVLFIGVTLLLASTYMTLYNQDRHSRDSVVKIAPPPPLDVKAGGDLSNLLDKPLDYAAVDNGERKEDDGPKHEPAQDGARAPEDLDKKLAEENADVGKEDYRHEPPNPKAPDDDPIKKSGEQDAMKEEESKPKEKILESANNTLVKLDVKQEDKEVNKGAVDVDSDKAKETEEKRLDDEKEIEQMKKEAQADADEAKGLLKELVKQREEQKALIEEQKQIIDELRQHHIDDHKADEAKKAADEAGNEVLGMLQLPQQQGQAVPQQQQVAQPGGAQQAGQPLVAQQGGQPLVAQQGGQPLVAQQGGQPLVAQQGGQPLVAQQGGQPLVAQQGGQPLVAQQGGQPVLQQQGGQLPVQQRGQPVLQQQADPAIVQQQVGQNIPQQQIIQQQGGQQPVLQQGIVQQLAGQPVPQQQVLQQQGGQQGIQQQGDPSSFQQQAGQQQKQQQPMLQPVQQQQLKQQEQAGYQQQGQKIPPQQAQANLGHQQVNEQQVPPVQQLPGQDDFAQQHFQQQQHPEVAQKQDIVRVAQANLGQQQGYPQQQKLGAAIQNGLENSIADVPNVNPAAVEYKQQNEPNQQHNIPIARKNEPQNGNIDNNNNIDSGKQKFLNVDSQLKKSAHKHKNEKYKAVGG